MHGVRRKGDWGGRAVCAFEWVWRRMWGCVAIHLRESKCMLQTGSRCVDVCGGVGGAAGFQLGAVQSFRCKEETTWQFHSWAAFSGTGWGVWAISTVPGRYEVPALLFL